MTKGEDVLIVRDYDLFDNNVKGTVGVYIKLSETNNKHMIYFPDLQEWGEFEEGYFELVKADFVPEKNKKFVDRVQPLSVTLET